MSENSPRKIRSRRTIYILSGMVLLLILYFGRAVYLNRQRQQHEEQIKNNWRSRGIEVGENPFVPKWIGNISSRLEEYLTPRYMRVTWIISDRSENTGVNDPRRLVTEEDMQKMSLFQDLEGLLVAESPITDKGLSHLTCRESLTTIRMQGTKITDEGIKTISRFPNLSNLDLYGSDVTDACFQDIAKLSNLYQLRLARNTKLTGKGIEQLSGLKKLNSLALPETELNDEGMTSLGKLRNIKMLTLWKTKISDESFLKLREMKQLQIISVLDTTISDEAVEQLQKELPKTFIQTDRNKAQLRVSSGRQK